MTFFVLHSNEKNRTFGTYCTQDSILCCDGEGLFKWEELWCVAFHKISYRDWLGVVSLIRITNNTSVTRHHVLFSEITVVNLL